MTDVRMSDVHAMNFLRECAANAYGSGFCEGTSGGKGNIGFLNGHVVKFRTHSAERRGEISRDMVESCRQLQEKMREALDALGVDPDLKNQILNNDFKLDGKNSLLDRKVMAKVIKKIETSRGAAIFDSAKGAYANMSSNGVVTTFTNVATRAVMRRANEISDEILELANSRHFRGGCPTNEQKLAVIDQLCRLVSLATNNFEDQFKELLPETGSFFYKSNADEIKEFLDKWLTNLNAAFRVKSVNVKQETAAASTFFSALRGSAKFEVENIQTAVQGASDMLDLDTYDESDRQMEETGKIVRGENKSDRQMKTERKEAVRKRNLDEEVEYDSDEVEYDDEDNGVE